MVNGIFEYMVFRYLVRSFVTSSFHFIIQNSTHFLNSCEMKLNLTVEIIFEASNHVHCHVAMSILQSYITKSTDGDFAASPDP